MNEKKVTDLLYKKFVGNDKDWKPEITGIHYADGFMRATNGFILAKVHFEEYDFDLEERIIAKNGSYIAGNYPIFEKLYSDLEETDTLISDLFKACKRLPAGTNKTGESVGILLHGFRFHTYQLSAIFELFEIVGEVPGIMTRQSAKHRTLVFTSTNCTAICISDFRDLTPKDLTFTINEALEFNPAQNKKNGLY
ncbi:MAG: hypothetical protein M1445_12735 [Bacteroidetes bacterium]|nr:hypothetical protein [Bacteroidota bacterium]MCL6101003.1 hypothetical protein [Bacteroidota bacterium]